MISLVKNLLKSQTQLALWVTVLFSGCLFALFMDWGNDDPYITYRYAENLYAGRGFVYNPGDPTLSTTTPFFALMLAGVRVFWSNLPHAANLIGAVSLAAGGLFLWDMARQWHEPLAGWAALILYPTFSLLVQTLGSETPFYLALSLGAIALYLRNKITFAAILLAFAVLTRGDAALLAVVLAADWLVKNPPKSLRDFRQLPWKAVAAGAGILLVWALFAIPYYGSPLPVTLAAKRAQGLMGISERFAPGFLTTLGYYTSNLHFWIEAFLMIIGLIAVLWRARGGHARPWFLLVSWTTLYFLAYTYLGVTRYFWYYAPLVPGMVGMIGLGLATVQRADFPAWTGSRVLPWFAILTLAGLAIAQSLSLLKMRETPDIRLAAYRMVGEWFTQNTQSKATIGTLEVGVIGYYALPRPMVDFAGLIQPEVASLFAPNINYQDTALWAIREYKPKFLVVSQGGFPYLEQTYLAENCAQVKKFPSEQTGSTNDLIIYKCP